MEDSIVVGICEVCGVILELVAPHLVLALKGTALDVAVDGASASTVLLTLSHVVAFLSSLKSYLRSFPRLNPTVQYVVIFSPFVL